VHFLSDFSSTLGWLVVRVGFANFLCGLGGYPAVQHSVGSVLVDSGH